MSIAHDHHPKRPRDSDTPESVAKRVKFNVLEQVGKCPLCLDYTVRYHSLSCGHGGCRSCLDQLPAPKRCMLCRTEHRGAMRPGLDIDNVVEQLVGEALEGDELQAYKRRKDAAVAKPRIVHPRDAQPSRQTQHVRAIEQACPCVPGTDLHVYVDRCTRENLSKPCLGCYRTFEKGNARVHVFRMHHRKAGFRHADVYHLHCFPHATLAPHHYSIDPRIDADCRPSIQRSLGHKVRLRLHQYPPMHHPMRCYGCDDPVVPGAWYIHHTGKPTHPWHPECYPVPLTPGDIQEMLKVVDPAVRPFIHFPPVPNLHAHVETVNNRVCSECQEQVEVDRL